VSDFSWNDSLGQAIARFSPENRGLTLFHEQRDDLVVRATDLEPPVSSYTRLSGIAAAVSDTGQYSSVHFSNPAPDDVTALVECLFSADRPVPTGNGGPMPASETLSPTRAARILAELVTARGDGVPGLSLSARFVAFEQRIRVARSDTPVAEDLRTAARVRLEARIARQGNRSLAVGEVVLGLERATETDLLRTTLRTTVGRAERRLGARPVAAAELPVVLAPGVGGVLVHEIVGHALEGDVARRGSWLNQRNKQVASECLGVLDDPRRGRAAWITDDEGERSGATALIVEGSVAGRLHDRRSAGHDEQSPTGHGRRSGFREPVLPRMGCTFVTPGRFQHEEVLESVKHGLYVRRMEAATTDPCTGRAVFRVTDADRLENGQLTVPLNPFLLEIDGPSALKSTLRVASDLTFDTCIGSCHREGQPLAISVGAPTISIGVAGVRT